MADETMLSLLVRQGHCARFLRPQKVYPVVNKSLYEHKTILLLLMFIRICALRGQRGQSSPRTMMLSTMLKKPVSLPKSEHILTTKAFKLFLTGYHLYCTRTIPSHLRHTDPLEAYSLTEKSGKMGFPLKSIRNIFSSKKKGETADAPTPAPAPAPRAKPNWLKRQAPPARGSKATVGLIRGQEWALNDLISAQNYEDWRARSSVVPVPDKKYSIQACAYAETKRYALGSHTDESLALILKTRDKAAGLKTSQQLVRFGHEVDHGPNAPRLPKFKKFDDGFVSLSNLVRQEVDLTPTTPRSSIEIEVEAIEDDDPSGVGGISYEHLKTGKTEYVNDDDSYVPASSRFDYMFEGEEESEAGSTHGIPDEDADSDSDESDDGMSWASDVNSDTYSLNPKVDEAKPIRIIKKSKPYEVDLRAYTEEVSDSHNHDDGFSVTKPTAVAEARNMEVDSRARQLSRSQTHHRSASRNPADRRRLEHKTELPLEVKAETRRPPPPPPTPRPIYILPSEAKIGRFHYTSPQGILRLNYIKSYLSLPPDRTPVQLILKLQGSYSTVAAHAAQANPALLRAADELDFDGILGTEELPYPPPPGGTLKQLTARDWQAQSVKMFLQEGSNLFFKVGRREQERIQRKWERMRVATTFEEETRIRAKMEGRVFRYADDRREELKEMRANRGKTDRKPRRLGWVQPGPSALSLCRGADDVDDEEDWEDTSSEGEDEQGWWEESEDEEDREEDGEEGDEIEYNDGEDDAEEDGEDDDVIGVPLYRVASHSSRGQG